MARQAEMIRVLYVCGSPFEGAEKSLLNLIASVENEVEPVVLVPEKGEMYKLCSEKGIKCICCRFTSVLLDTDYWKKVIIYPWRSKIVKYYRYDRSCLRIVKKIVKKQPVDLIHSNYTLTAFGATLSKKLQLPHVWHIREYLDGSHIHNKRIYLGRKWLRGKINACDARIAVSNPCRNYWQLKDENTFTILDAVSSAKDCCYNKDKQQYVLFCSYWLTEAKGIITAIRAYGMSGLGKQGIRLKVVGNILSEEIAKQIKAVVDEYGCDDKVDFLPVQKDIKPLFVNAMAFVQPSIHEGMGRTTAEAMFYGCPVIAHASGGTLDLVKHGETGYLFNTVEECAELMKSVCASNQEEVVLRAQDFAKQNLSIENYGQKIMEVYNKVLDSK